MFKILCANFIMIGMASFAVANGFDNFIGKYKTASAPVITPFNTNYCNRFNFKEIVGANVEADAGGSLGRTHIIYIQNPRGWSGVPTEHFNHKNEMGNGGGYGQTTSSETTVTHERAWWTVAPSQKELLSLTFVKNGDETTLSMLEAYYQDDALASSCTYEVKLTK